MKLSAKTQDVLKNFASINDSLVFRAGTEQRTLSPQSNILAVATLDDNFPQEFAILGLGRFLSVVSLFDNTELTFNEKWVTISGSGKASTRYVYADPSMVNKAPDKNIPMPSSDVEFELNTDVLEKVIKAAGVMGLDDISVVGDGNELVIRAHDKKNNTSDDYKLALGATDKTFNLDFKAENFKILPGTYKVTLSAKRLSKLEGAGVSYWLAAEASSTFKG